MTRRTCVAMAAGAFAMRSTVLGKDNDSMKEILEASLSEKKSVMLWVKGQSIGGVVLKIAGDMVELRNREYSRIVVRMDSIDAAAMV